MLNVQGSMKGNFIHITAFVVGIFVVVGTARADLRSESMALVDSAYAQAMEGNLPQALLINNEGLQAVPEDSTAIRCEFYSCLLYCKQVFPIRIFNHQNRSKTTISQLIKIKDSLHRWKRLQIDMT